MLEGLIRLGGRGVCWPHVNLFAFTVTGMEAVVPPVPTIIIIWNLYIYCKYSTILHLHMSPFLHWHPPATWGQASSSPRRNPVTSPCSDTGSGDIRSKCPGASGKSAYCGVPSGTVGRPAAGLMPSCGHLHLFWSTGQSPSISSALRDSVPGDTESHDTPVIRATCGCCRYQPVLHVAHMSCQSDLFFIMQFQYKIPGEACPR